MSYTGRQQYVIVHTDERFRMSTVSDPFFSLQHPRQNLYTQVHNKVLLRSDRLTRVEDVDHVEALVLVVAPEDHHERPNHGGAVVGARGGAGAIDGWVPPVPPLRVQHRHVVLPLPVVLCVCMCVLIKLHIAAKAGPVILVILCHSH